MSVQRKGVTTKRLMTQFLVSSKALVRSFSSRKRHGVMLLRRRGGKGEGGRGERGREGGGREGGGEGGSG